MSDQRKMLLIAAAAQSALGMGLAQMLADPRPPRGPSYHDDFDRPVEPKRRPPQDGHNKTKRKQVKLARKQRNRT